VIVRFHPNVYKQLQRLPRSVFASALDRIIALAAEPRPVGAVKLASRGNDWRIRIGEYRIIYEVDDAGQQITVLIVGHRRDVYDR
jgi:mRNA interferase RelE/StbE